MSSYGYSKQLNISFNEAIDKITIALKEQGFGILTDVDVKKTFKEKLNIDFTNYRILGACNPNKAKQALATEEEIGLLLPCNVIVYEKDNKTIVSAILPTQAFSIVDNKELAPLAQEVEAIFKTIIDNL